MAEKNSSEMAAFAATGLKYSQWAQKGATLVGLGAMGVGVVQAPLAIAATFGTGIVAEKAMLAMGVKETSAQFYGGAVGLLAGIKTSSPEFFSKTVDLVKMGWNKAASNFGDIGLGLPGPSRFGRAFNRERGSILTVSRESSSKSLVVGNKSDEIRFFSNSAKEAIVRLAQSRQGQGTYLGVDDFRAVVLKQGTKVYGGAPGQSEFYTTQTSINKFGQDARLLFEGLQVEPKPDGLRPGLTEYVLKQDTLAAVGLSRANHRHGIGGAMQIFIPEYKAILLPQKTILLKKLEAGWRKS